MQLSPCMATIFEQKDEEASRVLGMNINSMSFWLKDNYKVKSLKYIFETYGVNTAGLHEVCINWSDFKLSQMLVLLLRTKAENICSVASHNKQETENIGRYQRGDSNNYDRSIGIIRDWFQHWPYRAGMMVTVPDQRQTRAPKICDYSVRTMQQRRGWWVNSVQTTVEIYPREGSLKELRTMFREDPMTLLQR